MGRQLRLLFAMRFGLLAAQPYSGLYPEYALPTILDPVGYAIPSASATLKYFEIL
jgi:hypothetical protein